MFSQLLLCQNIQNLPYSILRSSVVIDFVIAFIPGAKILQPGINAFHILHFQLLFPGADRFRFHAKDKVVPAHRHEVPHPADEFEIQKNTAALTVNNDICEIPVKKNDMFPLTERQNF
jgi:hypothetical protein